MEDCEVILTNFQASTDTEEGLETSPKAEATIHCQETLQEARSCGAGKLDTFVNAAESEESSYKDLGNNDGVDSSADMEESGDKGPAGNNDDATSSADMEKSNDKDLGSSDGTDSSADTEESDDKDPGNNDGTVAGSSADPEEFNDKDLGSNNSANSFAVNKGNDDDSCAEFKDCEDKIASCNDRQQQPLMPLPSNAPELFIQEFAERYGDGCPRFYNGSLKDAVQASLLCKVKDSRPLAIYLHHDGSAQADTFCSEVLSNSIVAEFLNANFITWGWDLRNQNSRQLLVGQVKKNFGSWTGNMVETLTKDELPLLYIVSRNKGSNQIEYTVNGNSNADETYCGLLQSQYAFNDHKEINLKEETERAQRQSLLAEQEEAYQRSLEADRLKAQKKKQEEEEKQTKEEQARRLQEEEEERQKFEEAKREVLRLSLVEHLPEEPSESCQEDVVVIKFCFPNGSSMTRRFLADEPLLTLFNFCTVQGFHTPDDFKVITTFPRRDITDCHLDPAQTLKEVKLCPQEKLIVEER